MAEIKKEGMQGYMPYGYTQKPAMLGPYQAPAEGGPLWDPKPFLNEAEGYYQKRKQNDMIDLAYEGGGQEPVAAGNFRGMPVFRYPNGTLAVIGKDKEPRLMTATEIGQFMEQRARSGSTERLSDGQTAGADVMNTVGEWDSRMQQKIGKRYPKLAETYETLTNPEGTPLDQASKYMHGLASEHENDGNLALSTFADLGGYGLDLAKNLPGFVLPNPTSPLQVGGEVFLGAGIPAAVGAYKVGKRVAPVLARDAKTLAQSTAKAAKDTFKGVQALPELWGAIKHKRALEAKLAVTQDPVLREQIIQELGDADLAIREQELQMPEQELGFIPKNYYRAKMAEAEKLGPEALAAERERVSADIAAQRANAKKVRGGLKNEGQIGDMEPYPMKDEFPGEDEAGMSEDEWYEMNAPEGYTQDVVNPKYMELQQNPANTYRKKPLGANELAGSARFGRDPNLIVTYDYDGMYSNYAPSDLQIPYRYELAKELEGKEGRALASDLERNRSNLASDGNIEYDENVEYDENLFPWDNNRVLQPTYTTPLQEAKKNLSIYNDSPYLSKTQEGVSISSAADGPLNFYEHSRPKYIFESELEKRADKRVTEGTFFDFLKHHGSEIEATPTAHQIWKWDKLGMLDETDFNSWLKANESQIRDLMREKYGDMRPDDLGEGYSALTDPLQKNFLKNDLKNEINSMRKRGLESDYMGATIGALNEDSRGRINPARVYRAVMQHPDPEAFYGRLLKGEYTDEDLDFILRAE